MVFGEEGLEEVGGGLGKGIQDFWNGTLGMWDSHGEGKEECKKDVCI